MPDAQALSEVVGASWYGQSGHCRQRWWCRGSGERHRFTEVLPRIVDSTDIHAKRHRTNVRDSMTVVETTLMPPCSLVIPESKASHVNSCHGRRRHPIRVRSAIGDRSMISIRILRYIGVLVMGARYGVVRDVLQLRTVASARSPEAC